MINIEGFLHDFFIRPQVIELINTRDEAIEIEKILRELILYYNNKVNYER